MFVGENILVLSVSWMKLVSMYITEAMTRRPFSCTDEQEMVQL
jgi:hypothetical protein